MKSRMVGLFAVALIALMVAGLAYAHWTETLVLEGTVETGELNLTWSCECWDNEQLKDVGDVDCDIEGDNLTITVSNAYPCYEVRGRINITNTGTVPAVLVDYDIELPDDVTCTYYANGTFVVYYKGVLAAKGTVTFKGDPLTQIHETACIEFSIHFTNPGLPENWEGTAKITLYYENWTP